MKTKFKNFDIIQLNAIRENIEVLLNHYTNLLEINRHLEISHKEKYQELVDKRTKYVLYKEEIMKEIEKRLDVTFS